MMTCTDIQPISSKDHLVGLKQLWYGEGGGREVMRVALPLILSSSFMTLQVTIDRILLSEYSADAVAAAMPALLLFWTPFALLQNIANYATTFVAQYTGAGRPHRVGPAVWQSLYFSVAAGLAFMLIVPLAGPLVALGQHSPAIQELEVIYLRCLGFAALPALVMASVNSFFAGRGKSWIVLLVEGAGFSVNAVLAYAWIFGHWGFPAMGIEGAGWATVVGSATSAAFALTLFFQPRFQKTFQTLSGWRFDGALFLRMMRFGFPNGLQWMLDGLAFTFFLFLVGRLGKVELAATNITFSINMLAVLPMLGMGNGVSILVGQRLGQNRPALAQRVTWVGFGMAWIYMSAIAALYALFPQAFLYFFANSESDWPNIAALVPVLLKFVAVYSLFDSMNLTFSFALRGAGDTRFVTAISLILAWPLMVLPTWAALGNESAIYWAWTFVTGYIIMLGFIFMLRFIAGKWKSMRVIEQAPPPDLEDIEEGPQEIREAASPVCP
jgi:MATE family multidrug resistance protein